MLTRPTRESYGKETKLVLLQLAKCLEISNSMGINQREMLTLFTKTTSETTLLSSLNSSFLMKQLWVEKKVKFNKWKKSETRY